MAKYVINEAQARDSYDVEAAYFSTNGDFVDFYADEYTIKFRIRAADVHTIKMTE